MGRLGENHPYIELQRIGQRRDKKDTKSLHGLESKEFGKRKSLTQIVVDIYVFGFRRLPATVSLEHSVIDTTVGCLNAESVARTWKGQPQWFSNPAGKRVS